MTTIPEIAQAMERVLTETATQLGRETGFVQRQSKLDAATFAQSCVLGWLQHPDARVSQLVQMAARLGVPLSPQGFAQRFSPAAARFLQALLTAALTTLVAADPVAIPLLQRFSAVLVQDSTLIALPDALATLWPGCGNGTDQHLASLTVQPRLDLLHGTLDDLQLAAGRASDRTLAQQSPPPPPGSLILQDLGYFSLPQLGAWARQQVRFLSRLLVSTAVFDETGERLDLAAFLRQATTPTVELAVTLGATVRLPVRLLAARVRQEVADQRRRRLKEAARRHGRTVSAARLALVDWTILITNAPPEQLSLAEALVLARVRWQIELLFKGWKSGGQVDVWRSANPWRILCEVYAKLLGQLLQHWLLVAACWHAPDRSLAKATATIRDHAVLLAYALRGDLDVTQVLTLLQDTLQSCPRLERRRTHPATVHCLLEPPDGALA